MVSAALLPLPLTGGVPLTPGPVCQPLCVYARVQIRVDLAFLNRDFQKRIKEMIYRFCLNALEIHKLKNIAPNLMKQISICFLFLDLQ